MIQINPNRQIVNKIYVYSFGKNVKDHVGKFKIGETTQDVNTRLLQQTGTAGLVPIKHLEIEAKQIDGTWFQDKDLHRFFDLKGVPRVDFGTGAKEWYDFDGNLDLLKELIDDFVNLRYDKTRLKETFDYTLRDEQVAAVEKTLEHFLEESGEEFLWNAKPRFGKTLSSYDLIRKLGSRKVLVVTNRPATGNSWKDDYERFVSWREPIAFVSDSSSIRMALTKEEYDEKVPEKGIIYFISLQDLKGGKVFGGEYDKYEWITEVDWDLLIVDETHEGVDTERTEEAFRNISRRNTLHLSGTPFKTIANNKFSFDQIYNWSYLDEQLAKQNWDYSKGSNPYANMPKLNMFTYQMSEAILEELNEGTTILGESLDYTFDLGEFFKTEPSGRFTYEESVKAFLENLHKRDYPFSSEGNFSQNLNHTLWLVPGVASAKRLQYLLKRSDAFKDYKIVLAAGDGKSLEEEALNERANEKSYDKVKKAIEENEKTITLSCGQLTTGVTIPEWSGVFMLSNINSPALYFQAAFRAQNPYTFTDEEGNLYRKENAYIFDFSPSRTLKLYDEFANNLNPSPSRSSSERIQDLLNFFPVIGEDTSGKLVELSAEKVLSIPRLLESREVVNSKFQSNLLFRNISRVFKKEYLEIIEKISSPKEQKKSTVKEIDISDIDLDEDGNVFVPEETVKELVGEIFGEKVFGDLEYIKKQEEYNEFKERLLKSQKEAIEAQNLSKKDKNYLLKVLEESIERTLKETLEAASEEVPTETLEEALVETAEEIIEETLEGTEEKKKIRVEYEIKEKLRGFAGTIPMFLMAYGTPETTIENFEENIPEDTFRELTNITIEEFRSLRDGIDGGPGVFNNELFNVSIQRFLELKGEINWWENEGEENIFDYIPPQKNNQIFTPRKTVKEMLDMLEENAPELFSNPEAKVIDLYSKSGLYLTEAARRFMKGLSKEIPDEKERLKHILEKQIYGLCPSGIIYDIVRNYIFGNLDDIDDKNLILLDSIPLVKEGTLEDTLKETFGKEGEEDLKFDAIIGNPPYHEPRAGEDAVKSNPLFHLFFNGAFELSNKILYIVPGKFLFNAGNTPKEWNQKMLESKHVKVEKYEHDSSQIFNNTSIVGGVAVIYCDTSREFEPIEFFEPIEWVRNIRRKMSQKKYVSLDKIFYTMSSYRIKDDEELLDIFGTKTGGMVSNIFEKDKNGGFKDKPFEGSIAIHGRLNYKRVIKYVDKRYINYPDNLDYYKVLVPNSNGTGMIIRENNSEPQDVIGKTIVAKPGEGHTQTFIGFGKFSTLEEAVNLDKYINSKFTRFCMGMLKKTVNNARKDLWQLVPLQDFTNKSDIDWSKSIPEIDEQLYEKYGLTEEEIYNIETSIAPMD